MPPPSANRPPLRVAHVITRLDRGGSTDNTLLTGIHHDRDRFLPFILSGPSLDPEGELQKRARTSGVRFMTLHYLGRNLNPMRDLPAFFELLRIFRKEKFDIVHTHTSKAGILGRIAARLASVPVVVHTPHGHVFWGYYGSLVTRFFMAAERFCGRFSATLVALTEDEKNDYTRLKVEPATKIRVIPSGIELERFQEADRLSARELLRIDPQVFTLVTVARFEKVKNHAVLLEAASKLKSEGLPFRWVFLGDGPLLSDFQGGARSRGLEESFQFPGWRTDIPKLLPAFDLFVLCSSNEGMGRVFVEAQAAGLPVVASDICGIRSVVKDRETGFLHPPADGAAVAGSIRLLACDSALRLSMGRAARIHISGRFDAKAMVREIERLYGEAG